MEAAASVIAVLQLSAKVLSYLNDVKDSSKDRVQFAIEASNLHSLLLAFRFRLEGGDGTQEWYTAVRSLAVENGPLDQFKQALETLCNKMTDGGRLQKAGEALLWKFKKEEITKILVQMERLKSLIGVALEMDHFKLTQALKQDLNVVRTHIPVIRSDVISIRDEQNDTRHRMLLEWISTSDYPSQQSDIIGRRSEGTGQWFLSALKTARWLNETKATLFCPGIPGAGKTMMSAIVIQHLLDGITATSYGVAYVYCNYKAQGEQDTSHILKAVLKQLVQGRPSTIELIEKLFERHKQKGTKPSVDEMFSTLVEVIAHYPFVYMLIDALDECQDSTRREFCRRLRDLQVKHDVRIMATSRFIPETQNAFKDASVLEVRAHDEDIRNFVSEHEDDLPRCIVEPQLLKQVQEQIVKAAKGMFLLARLHLDSLRAKKTRKAVKAALDKLANGTLESAYAQARQRIEAQHDDNPDLAKRVISWIVHAKRPLTTAELTCALAVEPGEEELDPDNISDVEDLVSVCAGLIVVDHESAVIRLVHYTTQEYFERIISTWNPDANFDIATTCLTYLSLSVFQNPCSTQEELRERLDQNEFLKYAAKYLGEHTIPVERRVASSVCKFLLDRDPFLSFLQAKDGDFRYTGSGLHWTAEYGLCDVAQELLSAMEHDEVSEINELDFWDFTPLSTASNLGQYMFAKFLLDKGADVNHYNPLGWACEEGHEQLVKLLLDHGADIDLDSALYEASVGGHEQIVRLLLDRGANVDAQYEDSGSALEAASARGYEDIVQLLLDRGADVDIQGGIYGSALQAASTKGFEDIVQLLLDRGADVDAQGGFYGSALQAASTKGFEDIVQLLLEKGANVNGEGGDYDYALIAASKEGHEKIVKLLLKNGAEIDATSEFYGTAINALESASANGHEQIVRLLLRKGAEVDSQSIEEASSGGYKGIVELLLEKAADKKVIKNGLELGNAIVLASSKGYEQIVKLLLDHGAEASAKHSIWLPGKGKMHYNGLEAASFRGHASVVKLLLDNGAEVNDKAIEMAELRGHPQIAALLREKRAESKTSEI